MTNNELAGLLEELADRVGELDASIGNEMNDHWCAGCVSKRGAPHDDCPVPRALEAAKELRAESRLTVPKDADGNCMLCGFDCTIEPCSPEDWCWDGRPDGCECHSCVEIREDG